MCYEHTCTLHTVKDGDTPLMAAVQKNHLEAARVLLMECHCNTNAKNKVREMLHHSCYVSAAIYVLCNYVFICA